MNIRYFKSKEGVDSDLLTWTEDCPTESSELIFRTGIIELGLSNWISKYRELANTIYVSLASQLGDVSRSGADISLAPQRR